MLSLHGDSTTVPNSNGKLIIGLLIESEASWTEGVDIVLRANPAELGLPYIISRVTAEECLTFIFSFLQDITMVVVQEATGETRNVDTR